MRAVKHVIVIGGGDTGTDCVGTAMRQGCKGLTQIEILARPPMDRAEDNPWPEWPKIYKLDYAQEEAAAKFGSDPRVYVTTVKRLNGDATGRVQSLTTVQINWQKDQSGRFVPAEVPGSEKADCGGASAACDGVHRAGAAAAQGSRRSVPMRARTLWPSMDGSRRTSKVCSRRGIVGAGRVLWSGQSMRAVVRRVSAIGI